MKHVIGQVFRHPMQFAVGSLLAIGLLVSAVMSMATSTPVSATNASAKVGYSYGYKGKAKGHREHCPSKRGQEQSKGHAVCHIAPRHGR
jgi:hypothetical protein